MLADVLTERCPQILAQYLQQDSHLALLLLSQELEVLACNRGFLRLLNINGTAEGENLREYLLPESRSAFEQLPTEVGVRTLLSFAPRHASPLILSCQIYRQESGYLVFGEMLLQTGEDIVRQISIINNELAEMTRELKQQRDELAQAQSKIRVLGGLLPICSSCKKIRDDSGYWGQLEVYIRDHSEADFSHGICPECARKLYGDLVDEA